MCVQELNADADAAVEGQSACRDEEETII